MNDTMFETLSDGLDKEQLNYVYRSLKDIFKNDAASSMKHPGARKEYPIESDYKAIDFDNIKYVFVNTRRNEDISCVEISYRSNDALMLSPKGEWWFIECKNGSIGDKEIKEICEKIVDSNTILLNIDYLSKGKLIVDGVLSRLDRADTPDFSLYEKLKKLNMPLESGYIWEYMNYCLIYNKELYHITDADKMGWKKLLKKGDLLYLEDFYRTRSYLYLDEEVKTFLEHCIDDNNYPSFLNIMNVYDGYNDIVYRKRWLIKFFDEEDERDNFLSGSNRLRKIYSNLKKINSGEKFVIFLYLYANSSDGNIFKKMEEKNELLKSQEGALDNSSFVFLFKMMSKLSTHNKKEWKLFNLNAFEGKYFKKVRTLSEEEFIDYFELT